MRCERQLQPDQQRGSRQQQRVPHGLLEQFQLE
jgi:hypothetical protein